MKLGSVNFVGQSIKLCSGYRFTYCIYTHIIIYIPAEGKPGERFDWLLPGESQSPVIYNIKCSSDQFV